ncbi:hypothetical protein C1H76_8918 [Elsinoe australis]|uniref:Uncharacterized protein n=1 Tax=Elsinoe australis TaxID=40998 RepID=A0A4U7ALW0_9PEZI|nr:hypothetical protein C1H76_8918 [Elsinoe australis]
MLVQGHDTSAIQNAVHDLLSDARKEAIAADPYAAPAILDGIADTPVLMAECKELAATANHLLNGMTKEHEVFLAEHAAELKLPKQHTSAVSKALRSHQVLFQCFHSRAEALLARMNHLTNMALVTIQQHDSRTSTDIAKAAMQDSSSTKTISVLGLIFLPSTFVCSIFSTTFFSLQPVSEMADQVGGPPSRTGADRAPMYWILSDRFWIFWAVSVPLTLFTLLFWFVYTSFTRDDVRKAARRYVHVGLRVHAKEQVDEELVSPHERKG